MFKCAIPQLCKYLRAEQTYIPTLQVLLGVAKKEPQFLTNFIPDIKQITDYNEKALCITSKILSALSKSNEVI